MNLPFLLRLFCFCCVSILSLNSGVLFAAPLGLGSPAERIEGSVSSVANGITINATLQFQAPDNLRVQIAANPATLAGAQTIVASGDRTLRFDSQTRRVQQLPFNIVKQPWRDASLAAGGAANLALFGIDAKILAQFYNERDGAPNRDSIKAHVLLEAKASRMIQDVVRSGSSRQSLFYAVLKRRAFDATPRLQFIIDKDALNSWMEMDGNSGVLSKTTIEFGADKLPTKATTSDVQNRVLIEWKYDLKKRDTDFDDATFVLPDASKDQIIEDIELRPLADYENADNADSQFNLGVAQASHMEDFVAAFAAWNVAAKEKPSATAPHFATYEAAIATRDLKRAQNALDVLSKILGEDNFEIASRGSSLAAQRRDWKAAFATLEVAQKAQPQNLSLTLLRADILRGQSKFSEARALLLDILKSDAPQSETQVATAETLAASAWGEEANVLQTLPRDTQWQRLARAHLQLMLGEKTEAEGIADPLALASFAVGLEREKRDEAAIPIWRNLQARNGAAALVAAAHLEVLSARSGDVDSSLRNHRNLIIASQGEAERNRERAWLLDAWRKNFRQGELRGALEAQTISETASEQQWRAWLAFLEANGNSEEIGSAVRAATEKFDNALWHSRLAEQLLQERAALAPNQDAPRNALMKQAQAAVARAVELDATQPFYAMQMALIALQRVSEIGIIGEAGQNVATRDFATAALDKLERAFPDDADVALLIALGRRDLKNRGADSINEIAAALKRGLPGRESNRHETLYFGHQAVALGLRKLRRYEQAESEYLKLLDGVQSPSEFLGIAINYLAMQNEQAKGGEVDAEAVAAIFERAVAHNWSNAQSQQILQSLNSYELRNRTFAARLGNAMIKGNPSRQIAGAKLLFELERIANHDASTPDAPAATEKFWRQIQQNADAAKEKLDVIAGGEDALAAARASTLLAERALVADDVKNGVRLLQAAIAFEPRDIELRAILIRSLMADTRRDEAIAARDEMLKILPHDGETLRRAALLSLQLGLKEDAIRLATWAQSITQTARDASPAQLETASFVLARALMQNGQKVEAGALYKKLAGEQWGSADRAAALLDWEAQLRALGQNEDADTVRAQLDALNFPRRDVSNAQGLLQSLE